MSTLPNGPDNNPNATATSAGQTAADHRQTARERGIDPETVTLSGYAVDERYGPETVETADPNDGTRPHPRIAEPGQYPYTRGVHSTMYRSRLWTMRQFAGFGSADDTNARFKYLLEQAAGTKREHGALHRVRPPDPDGT